MAGLSVSDVVQVDIQMAPLAVPQRNFGALCIAGASPYIDPVERIREYATLDEVANDFPTTTPEFLAADLFFSQSPQPSICYIGRWVNENSFASLRGGIFTPIMQVDLLRQLKTIADGEFALSINGTSATVGPIDFTYITNLNGAATQIDGALVGANCHWDGERFVIHTALTGPTASLGYATTVTAGTGTDVSATLQLTQATSAEVPVAGALAETLLAAAVALRAHPEWYGLMFAHPTPIPDDDHIQVAQFIEGCDPVSIYGYTTQLTSALDLQITDDLPTTLKQMVLQRTFGQFSSSSPYAVASMYGRAFTVDFEANNSMITLKFKQEPGVQGEYLTQTEATALKAKNCNVFVFYSNGAAIIQEGVMAGGFFFDERHGMDALANRIQVDLFNVLYTSLTKIPQTDGGVHVLTTTVTNSLIQYVNNGFIAPGIWNAQGFGQLEYGNNLPLGFYVYAPLVASQPQSIRERRIAPTIQCAVKLAGAIHFAHCVVNVNR